MTPRGYQKGYPRVYVDGQEGTTGLGIFGYLHRRDDIELLRIDHERRRDIAERARLINRADVVFLCLPDDASREAATLVDNPHTCLIDASSAFRTHPEWTYGLPELAPGQREAIHSSHRIANVGCHASAFIMLVRPLVEAGLLSADYPLSAFSLTGYSGGGKKMIAEYENAANGQLDAPRPYGLTLNHKHLPEMKQHSGLAREPVFNPVVGNFLKGLAVTVPLHVAQLNGDARALHRALSHHYEGAPFVRVMPLEDEGNLDRGYFDVAACNDTNRADLFVFGGEERVALVARLDNLGKGAAGSAVQNMNIHLGLDETTGLSAG